MPVHDWSTVDAGIFHHFHHGWIEEIARSLNRESLPADYYALAEQHASHFGPDVLTLQHKAPGHGAQDEPLDPSTVEGAVRGGLLIANPRARLVGETDLDFYLRKQSVVTVRHVSGDRLVAIVEIVSPGNKSSRAAFQSLVDKAVELLAQDIYLLILDLLTPTLRDPNGIHGAIWEELANQEYVAPSDRPLTLAACEADAGVRAHVEHVAIGESLLEMPLFLRRGGHVPLDLEATYGAAWEAVPRRWRGVIESGGSSTG